MGILSGCSYASATWSGHSNANGEGQGRYWGNNQRGVAVVEENKEAAPNEKAGAKYGTFVSLPLLSSDRTDEEGESQN